MLKQPEVLPQRDRAMLDAALDLMATAGLKAVTARRVAAGTGASPAAINQRFGSKEAMVAAAFELARARDLRWRQAELAALPPSGLVPPMLAGFLHAVVHADGAEQRRLSRARWECYIAAELGAGHRDIAARWNADHEAFWARALAMFGLTERAAGLVAEFADGVARLYLGGRSALGYAAWSGEASHRFMDRLLRRVAAAPTAGAWRLAHLEPAPDFTPDTTDGTSSVVDRILDGAAKLLGRVGPRGLSHRAVAAAAGVSLSSITYRFPSRADMLRAAYRRLYTAWIARSADRPSLAGESVCLDVVIERMMDAMLIGDAVAPEQLVHQLVQLEASRDPELGGEMDRLRAAAGRATLDLIHRIDGIGIVDELDGFCFATWVIGAARSTRLFSGPDRRAHLRGRYEEAFELLFGVSSTRIGPVSEGSRGGARVGF